MREKKTQQEKIDQNKIKTASRDSVEDDTKFSSMNNETEQKPKGPITCKGRRGVVGFTPATFQ